MTMFPAHDLRKKQSLGGYGGGCRRRRYLEGEGDDDYYCFMSLGSDSDFMANDHEDESRISNNELIEEAQGSSSKDDHQEIINKDDGWLQLSLGSHYNYDQQPRQEIAFGPRSLVELDLLPAPAAGGGGESSSTSHVQQQQQQQLMMMMRPLTLTAPPLSLPLPLPLPLSLPQQQQQQQQLMNFHEGSFLTTTTTSTPGTSLYRTSAGGHDSMAMSFTDHQQQQQQQYDYLAFIRPNYPMTSTSSHSRRPPPPLVHFAPPIRVVDPPPRPHSGLWFMLQASLNQTKEPYLPQLPKTYLRIRDGRTSTVGLLIKYLVNKLKLDSEFEIEITCKGQQLLPFMTLHHVRDNIWHNPRSDAVFSRTSANIDDHLMVLKYGRIA